MAEWKRRVAFSSGVTLTCTLYAACQRLGKQGVQVSRPALAAVYPARFAPVGKIVPKQQLIERRKRQMPKRLLNGDAVFGDPSGKAKLPSRAGR
jgi:hypothetical protein